MCVFRDLLFVDFDDVSVRGFLVCCRYLLDN